MSMVETIFALMCLSNGKRCSLKLTIFDTSITTHAILKSILFQYKWNKFWYDLQFLKFMNYWYFHNQHFNSIICLTFAISIKGSSWHFFKKWNVIIWYNSTTVLARIILYLENIGQLFRTRQQVSIFYIHVIDVRHNHSLYIGIYFQ